MTQSQLAELCEISTTFVGEIETGIKYPAPKTFEKLAKMLKVQPYVLLMPKDIVIDEVDKNELLQMFTEDVREMIQMDLESVLTKYLKK